ncbi:MAG TPA: sodium:calcium antiporter [Syntrophomonadaceae bacterium]|nr:sodium:calcium antiporter [Syntrophomonadaceae bacterium]
MGSIALLIIALGIILAGAEIFVNGVEWLGKRLDLSEGAVGSVLAAVGTALPETIIPIIAIVFSHGQEGHDIGIGAILGAPLMLATLAMFISGIAVFIFKNRRDHGTKVLADYSTMSRDLSFFVIMYTSAILAGVIPAGFRWVQILIAVILALSYCWYVYAMVSEERDVSADHDLPSCYFDREKARLPMICLQVVFALILIVLGANLFVDSVKAVAMIYAVPVFVLAIIITPIATELPEKFNSVIWISREKDTLALGNITGAMVFQSSLIPAMGILLTDWQLTSSALLSALLALLSAGLILFELKTKKHISALYLLSGGLFYAIFLFAVFSGFIR